MIQLSCRLKTMMVCVFAILCLTAPCPAASIFLSASNYWLSASYVTPSGNVACTAGNLYAAPSCPVGTVVTGANLYGATYSAKVLAPDTTSANGSLFESNQPGSPTGVQASATLWSQVDTSASAYAQFSYYFEWVGPYSSGDVLTDFGGSLDFSTTGAFGYGSASITISNLDGGVVEFWDAPNPNDQVISMSFPLIPNDIYVMTLIANVTLNSNTDCCSEYSGVGSVTVDPTITIDPSFPYASDYTLALSSDLEPPSAVPEPASFAITMAALCLLGCWHRTLRRQSR